MTWLKNEKADCLLLHEVKSFPLGPGRTEGLGRTGSQGEESVWVRGKGEK